MIKAIIFDMDGVLVDSEPLIREASIRALREYGVTARHDDFREFTGMGEDRFVGGVAEKHGVPYQLSMKNRAYEIYLELLRDSVIAYGGAKPLIERLSGMGYILAVASAADRIKVEANIESIGVTADAFAAVITGSDVERKKPHPEIYLTASRAIGVPPEGCFVVEDALSGVEAAKRAGMACAAVTTSFLRERLTAAGADFVVDDVIDVLDNISFSNYNTMI